MSTRISYIHVLFLMLNAPIRDKKCEGEEIGKHDVVERIEKKKGPQRIFP